MCLMVHSDNHQPGFHDDFCATIADALKPACVHERMLTHYFVVQIIVFQEMQEVKK